MNYIKTRLITNRFELVMLILLSFIISTRLIWLQIDDRNQTVTDEFYSSSLLFKSHLGAHCAQGIESAFPYPSDDVYWPLDAEAEISPGLILGFFGTCQFTRLSLPKIFDFAPLLIGFSALIVAISTRLLISNWVGGMLAASVVLSRGSILQGTHHAGTFLLLQPAIALSFLVLILFARTRQTMWLPVLFSALLIATFISPTFSVLAWVLILCVLIRSVELKNRKLLDIEQFRMHLVSAVSILIVLPSFIFSMYSFFPKSTKPLATFIKQHVALITNITDFKVLLGSTIAELEIQDFHWQLSLAALLLAATWRRFLPRGSGFASLTLGVLAIAALYIDGTIIAAAAKETQGPLVRRVFKMRQAIFSLEPLIIGIASGYGWFGVRYIISTVFPKYGNSMQVHDKIENS